MTDNEAFDTLGLQPGASAEQIKAAYRRAASAAHPDRAGGSSLLMQAINRAYEHLTTDPAERQKSKVQAMAAELLVAVFGAAIDNDNEPVAHARQKIMNVGEQLRGKQPELAQRRAVLERRSGKTTVRDGENLVQMLIEQRLAKLNREQGELEEAIAANAEALRMLSAYVGEPPAQPSFNEITFAQIAQMAGYGYGRGTI